MLIQANKFWDSITLEDHLDHLRAIFMLIQANKLVLNKKNPNQDWSCCLVANPKKPISFGILSQPTTTFTECKFIQVYTNSGYINQAYTSLLERVN